MCSGSAINAMTYEAIEIMSFVKSHLVIILFSVVVWGPDYILMPPHISTLQG